MSKKDLPNLVNDPDYRKAMQEEEDARQDRKRAENDLRVARADYERTEEAFSKGTGTTSVEDLDRAEERRAVAVKAAREAATDHERAKEAFEEIRPRKQEEVLKKYREEQERILSRAFEIAEELHALEEENRSLKKLYGKSTGTPYPAGFYAGDLPAEIAPLLPKANLRELRYRYAKSGYKALSSEEVSRRLQSEREANRKMHEQQEARRDELEKARAEAS